MQVFTPDDLEAVANLLRQGGVLVYPTETSYALGCDATNEVAVARVIAIKGRPTGKGTPFILPPDHEPDEYIALDDLARKLIQAHWPGPLNIVAVRQPASPVSKLCETDGSQAVRQSSHPVASELARLLGRPLMATSANRADQPSSYTAAEVMRVFSDGLKPDAFLNVGDLPLVPASTTVKVQDGKVEVVRQGSIVINP